MSLDYKQTIKENLLTLGLLNCLLAEVSQYRNAESDVIHSAAPENDELLVGKSKNWLNETLASYSFLIELY